MNPYEHFTAEAIAAAAQCPLENVRANWPRLVEQLTHCGINDRMVQLGMIGTIAKESASTFAPVKEAFFLDEPRAENYRKTLRYYPYYGRGFIQNTWEDSYRELGTKIAQLWGSDPSHLDFDLVGNPDRLLDPDMSAAAAAIFFRDKAGGALVAASRAGEWDDVRRLVLGGADPEGTARIARIARELGETTTMPTIKLSDVLARARSRVGDPYVWGGKVPPSTDCSGFAAWCYEGRITSFTDAVLNETERVEKPAPGDLILYEYQDPGQPGVRFPHMGLFISDTVTLDNRFGMGVGEHPQLPRSSARRYYRRLPGVVVDSEQPVPAPQPVPDPRDARIAALEAENAGLRSTIGYLTVDVAGALQAAVNTLAAHKPAA